MKNVGDDAKYLVDNMELELLFYENEILDYEMPLTMEMEVVEAESRGWRRYSDGANQKTPLFVGCGDLAH